LRLSEIDDDETDAIVLLGDLADIFDGEEREDPSSESMPSAEIVRELEACLAPARPSRRTKGGVTMANDHRRLKWIEYDTWHPQKSLRTCGKPAVCGFEASDFDH
jgi:hypothetical protein